MVINMRSIKDGECKVCGHSFTKGFPVKLEPKDGSLECQQHPQYIVKVTEVETTDEERATLKSEVGFTVIVTSTKSENAGNVLKLTEKVLNPRYGTYFFTGYNVTTGQKANLGLNTKCIVLFKTVTETKENPYFVPA